MKNITIYTTNACPYCIKTKEYLAEKGIKYDEKNVQENSQAKNVYDILKVPQILIENSSRRNI